MQSIFFNLSFSTDDSPTVAGSEQEEREEEEEMDAGQGTSGGGGTSAASRPRRGPRRRVSRDGDQPFLDIQQSGFHMLETVLGRLADSLERVAPALERNATAMEELVHLGTPLAPQPPPPSAPSFSPPETPAATPASSRGQPRRAHSGPRCRGGKRGKKSS